MFLCLLVPFIGVSQGKIMLVGGGAELDTDWSWSNIPYRWAVDQSANKKVAIISFSLGDDPTWLPDYFVSLGAAEATNFEINSLDMANNQATYDALMGYDVFFFKGGDQSNYYTTYKGTKMEDAITDKFYAGGVIGGTSAGMAILSGIVYTAENRTVYPDEVLRDVYSPAITLKDDFLGILDDYVVDTHFIERGRFARLLAFIGNWYLSTGEWIGGIGVDDRTAFCIDAQKIGITYGTGAVSIYSTDNFEEDVSKPVSDSIHAVQLLHGTSYDLDRHEIVSGYNNEISPLIGEENGAYTLYLSGSNPLGQNSMLLNDFLINATSDVVIVSRSNSPFYSGYFDYIVENSDFEVHLLNPSTLNDTCQNVSIRNAIRASSAFLFVDNDHDVLLDFLKNDKTGVTLKKYLFNKENVIAFVGEDSKLSGITMVTNNKGDALNAYYGDLTYQEGLGLLSTSIVMPNTYDPSSADFYENNAAAVQYALVAYRLKYGFYLNENSYVKFYRDANENLVDSYGTYSSILLTNTGQKGAVADQQVNSSGDVRNVAGFDQMKYSLFSNTPIKVGKPNSALIEREALELLAPQALTITTTDKHYTISWTDKNTDVSGFVVERSVDGISFSKVGDVAPANSTFVDTDIVKGKQYQYRIAAYNADITSCYSNIVELSTLTGTKELNKKALQIYPNPTKGVVVLAGISKHEQSEVAVFDTQGRRVNTYFVGENSTIDLAGLMPGIYYLKINNSKQLLNKKIIIIND